MVRSCCFTLITSLAWCCTAACQDATSKNEWATAGWELEQVDNSLLSRLGATDDSVRKSALSVLKDYVQLSFALGESSFGIEFRQYFRTNSKPILPKLIELLDHTDTEVVQTAAALIMLHGTEAQSAVVPLKKLVDVGQTQVVRDFAARAILFVTPETEPVTQFLVPWLMSWCGPIEGEPISPGESLPNGRSMGVALTVPAVAMPLLFSGHTKVEVPRLLKLITNKKYSVDDRAMLVLVLGEFGPDGKGAIPKLKELLQDEEQLVRRCAASALLSISMDPGLVDMIVNSLKMDADERDEFRKDCLDFLEREAKDHAKSIQRLSQTPMLLDGTVAMLKSRSGYYRRQAIRDLADYGIPNSAAVSSLQAMLDDPDDETRLLAKEALRKIQKQ